MTVWRAAVIVLATVGSLAAAPSGSFLLTTSAQPFTMHQAHVDVTRTAPAGFTPAPLPNRDAEAPPPPRGTNVASVSPSLFSHKDQYRGDGFSPNSTAQVAEERHLQPGAGIRLSMPVQ